MSHGMFRSFLMSMGLHGILLVPAGFLIGYAADARTDVLRGVSSIELEHVSSSAEIQKGSGPIQQGQAPSGFFDDGGGFQKWISSGLGNPAPRYPWAARVNGWEGTVLVGVRVTSGGGIESLRINRSSGYSILDGAALEAVRYWRFIPARQGFRKVASTVEIPITFLLKDEP